MPRLPLPDEGLPAAKIAIRHYNMLLGNRNIQYRVQPDIIADDPLSNMDLLWKVCWPFRPKRPGWSGMMQAFCKGEHPGKSSVHFLPMIDMDPTDMTCIYSTLLFVADESRKHSTSPILTFDQPLWFKAKTIISSEPALSDLKHVILKLGSFHAIMSYLGSIGHLMNSSGLREVLGLLYADNAVNHILTGKAYARAVRGHTLIDAALNSMVVTEAYDVPPADPTCGETVDHEPVEQRQTHPDLKEALGLFDAMLANEISADDVCSSPVFQRIYETLDAQKAKLSICPTGRLWLQYMTMVDVLRTFIKAERTGDFKLHLKTLQTMLPYLAASGHTHYTKSAHIYIQDMYDLKETNPKVYDHFLSGHFVIRRSDRFWSGLSTDLVIEQVLMRSLKTTGGLTRGRGMEEAQRTR